jgi:hypothetical protein
MHHSAHQFVSSTHMNTVSRSHSDVHCFDHELSSTVQYFSTALEKSVKKIEVQIFSETDFLHLVFEE